MQCVKHIFQNTNYCTMKENSKNSEGSCVPVSSLGLAEAALWGDRPDGVWFTSRERSDESVEVFIEKCVDQRKRESIIIPGLVFEKVPAWVQHFAEKTRKVDVNRSCFRFIRCQRSRALLISWVLFTQDWRCRGWLKKFKRLGNICDALKYQEGGL